MTKKGVQQRTPFFVSSGGALCCAAQAYRGDGRGIHVRFRCRLGRGVSGQHDAMPSEVSGLARGVFPRCLAQSSSPRKARARMAFFIWSMRCKTFSAASLACCSLAKMRSRMRTISCCSGREGRIIGIAFNILKGGIFLIAVPFAWSMTLFFNTPVK